MRHLTLVLALAFAIVLAPARASQITFQNLPSVEENGTFNGFTGAIIDGLYANIVCDDYYSTTYVPSGPLVFQVSTLPTLTYARFGSDDAARQRYTVAAILVQGLADAVDPHAISSYHYALWTLFEPSVASYGDSAALLAAAQNDVLNPSPETLAAAQKLVIYTPVSWAASNQEFLGLSLLDGEELVDAPEPGTTILMGIGFILLSVLVRKKSCRSGS